MRYAVVGICCLVSACVHYEPQPLSVAEIAEAHQTAALDPLEVRESLASIAPSRHWDDATWDEPSLFAAALAYRPGLETARAGAATAAADAAVARVRPGPSFALLTEYAFHPNESSNWQVGVSADQLVDAGGRRRARINSADIAARAAEFAYYDALWSARTEVATAIADLSATTRTVELQARIAELRKRQLAAVEHRVREGLAPRLDLDQVRAASATDAAASADASAALTAARLALARAVGVAPDSVQALVVTPEPLPVVHEDLAGLRSGALEARLDIFNAIAAYDQAEESLRSAVAAQYPEVHVGPGYAWERGLAKLPFVLTLSFPDSDFGKAGIAAAEARRREAARRLEAAVADDISNVDRARADFLAAGDRLDVAREQALPAAQTIAAQATRALDAGVGDRAGWVDAQITALNAEVDLVAAERRCRLAQIALEDSVRRPLSDPAMREAIENARTIGRTP